MNDTLSQESTYLPMKVSAPDSAASPANKTGAAASTRPFDDVFLEHWTRVYGLLVRLVGDPSEAEDLALETFLKLYQRPPAVREGFSLGGWLYRVATNLGLKSIRSFKRRERYELSSGKGAFESAPEDRPAEILAEEEERRNARVVLDHMNPRQAQLLILRYSGISYKEIAAALDLSPTSIGPMLLRAEREFEKQYRVLMREE